jgi:hypothetical protein
MIRSFNHEFVLRLTLKREIADCEWRLLAALRPSTAARNSPAGSTDRRNTF